MLIFSRKKLVLFAVPKTGTTALEEALAPHADSAILAPPGQKHCGVAKYERELQRFFESSAPQPFERLAIVRAPVSWLGSWYRYRRRDALRGKPAFTGDVSFAHFIEAWLSDDPPAFARVGQQARFLDALSGRAPRVTHLFRYEAMPQAATFLEQRLAQTITLPTRNVSPAMDLHLPPALETRLRVERPDEFRIWDMAQGG